MPLTRFATGVSRTDPAVPAVRSGKAKELAHLRALGVYSREAVDGLPWTGVSKFKLPKYCENIGADCSVIASGVNKALAAM